MANKTLQNSVDWVQPLIKFMPLTIGTGNEPAITNANIILQTIVGPPFAWRWNRGSITFTTVAGTQDYTVAVSDFGFPEKYNVQVGSEIKEIEVQNVLALGAEQGRPKFCAAQSEVTGTSVTFRLLPVPEQVYTVTVTYQRLPVLFTALGDSWPIPDDYSFIYNYGFLALSMAHADDPRMPFFNQKFMAALLSTARGLTDTERNIFIGNWMSMSSQRAAEQFKTQQGVTARGA